MIQFLLNDELRSEDNLDPNTTVLKYLREQLGKTGTKEGCASGDCGACTVVLGSYTTAACAIKASTHA
ncbi:2Fe-2S iron-sulfur cluster-binding protein [Aliamphritea spongicola]|nr:2Fe-2S iron-sulfur cluster-binding protein [Aliamphritea spongicola]